MQITIPVPRKHLETYGRAVGVVLSAVIGLALLASAWYEADVVGDGWAMLWRLVIFAFFVSVPITVAMRADD